MHPLEQLRDDALAQIASAADERVLESVRVRFLGTERQRFRMERQNEVASERGKTDRWQIVE
jgi:hypothetical protein